MVTGVWQKAGSKASFAADVARRCASRVSNRLRLAYVGWLGHENLGDEAMFHAIRSLLPTCELLPYRSAARESVLRRLKLGGAKFFDAAVLGGGTLVNPGFWPVVHALAGERLPMVMFGTGVGSSGFGQGANVDLTCWSSAASNFFAVGVRGPASRRDLEALGFRNVQVIGDPALSLVTDVLPPRTEPPRLIVNLAGHPPQDCLVGLAHFLAEFAASGGRPVGLAVSRQDMPAFDRLLAMQATPRFKVVMVTRDQAKYVRLVSGARAVIAVRLHAAVLACCAGTPPLLFAYRPKCEDFMASMELTEFLLPWEPAGCAMLDQLWSRIEREGEALRRRIWERARSWRDTQVQFARSVLHKSQGACERKTSRGPAGG